MAVNSVRLNPYHPITPYVAHALVPDGHGWVDLVGPAQQTQQIPTFGVAPYLESTDNGRPGLYYWGGASYWQLDGVDDRIKGSTQLSFFTLLGRRLSTRQASFTIDAATPSSSARVTVLLAQDNKDYYGINTNSIIGTNPATLNYSLRAWNFDGNRTGNDRVSGSRDGQDVVSSYSGTAPASVATTLNQFTIGNYRHWSANVAGYFGYFIVTVGASWTQDEMNCYTGDPTYLNALFRGPRTQIYVPAGGPSTITGSGAASEAADTSSGSGTVVTTITGSGAATEGADTSSGSGSLAGVISGSGAQTEAADTSSGSGTVSAGAITGSGSPVEGKDRSVGVGVAPSKGGGWATNQKRLERLANIRRDDEEVAAILGALMDD